MNKKGQTLIIFVILIPIIMAIFALVIDIGLMTYENVKLKNTTKTILKEGLKNNDLNENYLKKMLLKNGINCDNLKIYDDDNKFTIYNQYFISSMFGKILGIKEYEVNVKAEVTKETNSIIIK